MLTPTSQRTNLPTTSKTCKECKGDVEGLIHDGYLWPLWMAKKDSTLFPPHGPRLFNIELMQCWTCCVVKGGTWHR